MTVAAEPAMRSIEATFFCNVPNHSIIVVSIVKGQVSDLVPNAIGVNDLQERFRNGFTAVGTFQLSES